MVFGTGIQWGKTASGGVRLKRDIHRHTDPSDAFLITAPTYKILSQSTLPAFLRIMEGCGEYLKGDAVYRTHWGTNVYCRTETDPNSIVGITNIRSIWGDEAGLYGLYFWENIQARAAFREAPITLTTSPYTLNWLYKEIIRPKMRDPDARPDVELIQAASWENPYMPTSVIDRAREVMDERRFNAMFGGQWIRMAGLVYDCFHESENVIAPFTFPTDTRYVGGIDWGYTEPFVLLIHAITPAGRRYQVSETYKSGMTINDIIDLCRQKRSVFGLQTIYCDPSQPGYIEELNRNGIPAVPANNDIRPGIDYVYELLKSRQLKFIEGSSPHTIDELDSYHYPEPKDLRPDDNAKDVKPVGQNDHALDALRYLCIMTKASDGQKVTPKNPEENKVKTQYDKLKELRKKKNYGGQTENWS